MLQSIKTKYLLNRNGKIEGQRISEKWFLPRGLADEFKYLQDNGIKNAQDIYDFENPGQSKCECSAEKRFVGYSQGYKEFCEACGRSKNNSVFKTGDVDLELLDIPKYVKGKNGYSTSKLTKLSPKTLLALHERTSYIEDGSLSERIYHLEHNLFGYPTCKHCGNTNKNFYTAKFGYKDNCSNTCGYALVDYEERHIKFREALYNTSYLKYSNINELDLTDDYTVQAFTKNEYVTNKDPSINLTHICGLTYSRNISYQGSFQCPDCYPVRSKSQYQVYQHLLKAIPHEDMLYDKRSTLNGLELDIELINHKIAIEYNGIIFHSFGKNTHTPFNNFAAESAKKNSHLSKTELCEDIGIQLFHIFSNEWLNKQGIWESVLNNSIGKSERIYARKTVVKEVPNKEAKEFQEANHLQSAVNASIKLGLYYNEELVSLMTFGKSRYNKDIKYELLRFCNKLNLTVVGGASKLLKHFERTYSPKGIVSYANRRWSQGNLYDALGFEFQHCTSPNYFYFKTGSELLESRVKYQKHKLKDTLELFDPKLTETENMYNNNYRKIYDSGNKVYIKTF